MGPLVLTVVFANTVLQDFWGEHAVVADLVLGYLRNSTIDVKQSAVLSYKLVTSNQIIRNSDSGISNIADVFNYTSFVAQFFVGDNLHVVVVSDWISTNGCVKSLYPQLGCTSQFLGVGWVRILNSN